MDESHDGREGAIRRRRLARVAAHLIEMGGMPEGEALSEAEKAVNSPDPFGIPTSEQLDDPPWNPEPVAWPPPGWDPRVLAAMHWAMVEELDGLTARCEAAIVAGGGQVPEDDAAER